MGKMSLGTLNALANDRDGLRILKAFAENERRRKQKWMIFWIILAAMAIAIGIGLSL